LIQNILPAEKKRPKDWIHRLVTMGTPHKGIDLALVPDFIERAGMRFTARYFKANIFEEGRMRQYLNLPPDYEPHSLGDEKSAYAFPVKRCLCLIGSDYADYGPVRIATGAFSDGLVKQDRAYVVAGKPDANGRYGPDQKPFWANVHRAHSGWRGIVNSYESFENIHRFLFGDVKADIFLENVTLNTAKADDTKYFYDVEFALSIRGTPVYLHRRQQDPCENAIRYERDEFESKTVLLHTVFMNSDLRISNDEPYSHFQLQFRVRERAIKKVWFWDREYPDKTIYSEDVEVRVGDFDQARPGTVVQYRWLSEGGDWRTAERTDTGYRIPLRQAGSLTANFLIAASPWPDANCQDVVPPSSDEENLRKLQVRKPKTPILKKGPDAK